MGILEMDVERIFRATFLVASGITKNTRYDKYMNHGALVYNNQTLHQN